MCENWDFVAPVNMLTPFPCTPFSWAAQHYRVSWCYNNLLFCPNCTSRANSLLAFTADNTKFSVKFATKFNLKSDALSNTFAATEKNDDKVKSMIPHSSSYSTSLLRNLLYIISHKRSLAGVSMGKKGSDSSITMPQSTTKKVRELVFEMDNVVRGWWLAT